MKRQLDLTIRLASDDPFVFRNKKSEKLYDSKFKKTMTEEETDEIKHNAIMLQNDLSRLIVHFEEIVDEINNYDY